MNRETRLGVGVAGTRVHYLLILPGLVPVRPIEQRRGFLSTGAPKMEMKYMHLREGTSGVPSKVGMAKTGRCGGKVGCGCPGRNNVRAEAIGRKAGHALKEKRSCASSHWGNRGAFTCSGVGGRFAPLAVSPAPVPPPPSAQPNVMLLPAPRPHWLNYTATHQRCKDAKQIKGWDLEELPPPPPPRVRLRAHGEAYPVSRAEAKPAVCLKKRGLARGTVSCCGKLVLRIKFPTTYTVICTPKSINSGERVLH